MQCFSQTLLHFQIVNPRRSAGRRRPARAGRLVSGFAFGCALGALGIAQVEEAPTPTTTSGAGVTNVLRDSHGIAVRGGTPIAGGADYRARFEPGRFELTPALGPAAPVEMPLAFELESIQRGGRSVLRAAAPVAPTVEEGSIAFYRAGGIEERYEVRADGVHQTFLFPERLAGSGDLVVRGRLETELAYSGQHLDGGLRFELPGVGGVHYGGVTGIDADGDSIAGSLRFEDGFLELILPGDFVDGAAYPLLLDPLIGSEFDFESGSSDDGSPSIAFDSSELTYLVSWERTFSAVSREVRAQRMSNTGVMIGGMLFLSNTAGIAINPSVGVVAGSDRFFVAWQESAIIGGGYSIVGTAVDADTGSLSSKITVASSINTQSDPAVGSERTSDDDELVVVFSELGVGIRAVQVTVPAGIGNPTPAGPAVLVDSFDGNFPAHPAISLSSGDDNRFLIVWERLSGSGDWEIFGRFYDRDLSPLGSGVQRISDSSAGINATAPSVDGDGTNFVVAWEVEEEPDDPDHDVVARGVSFANGDLHLGTPVVGIEEQSSDHEYAPVVAYTGETVVVAYLDDNTLSTGVYARSIDPFTCLSCEDEFTLQQDASSDAGSVGIGSMWSGGDTAGFADDALIVWGTLPDGQSDSDLIAIRYDSYDPGTDFGGGCGAGGEYTAPCLVEGNDNFRPALREAAPNAFAYLLTSLDTGMVPCGACTLVPAIDGSAMLFGTVTDAWGNADVSLPLPLGLAGVTVYSQWAVRVPGGSCPLIGGLELSNALETQFQ